MTPITCIEDLRQLAERRVPRAFFQYVDSGSYAEETFRANRADMRESFLSLTGAGRAMYEDLAPHAIDFAHRLTAMVAPADHVAFDRVLKLLIERSARLVAEVAQGRDSE